MKNHAMTRGELLELLTTEAKNTEARRLYQLGAVNT